MTPPSFDEIGPMSKVMARTSGPGVTLGLWQLTRSPGRRCTPPRARRVMDRMAAARPGRPVGSLLDLGLGALLAPRSFPPTNPRQCWDGDDGPKIDLESTILAGWRQDQEDHRSLSPVVPAAAF